MTTLKKANWFLSCGLIVVGSYAFSSDVPQIGSIELHALAHLSRHGESLVISCFAQDPITITSSGMDLTNYESQNYFGVYEQFPIAILVKNDALIFYHSALVENKSVAARSTLTMYLNSGQSKFISLDPATRYSTSIYLIDKNLNVKIDESPVNLGDSDARSLNDNPSKYKENRLKKRWFSKKPHD
jgi:hypothetical protein